MVRLKVSPDKAILLIRGRIDDIHNIGENQDGSEYYDFIGWLSKTWAVIDEIYGAGDTHPEEMRIIGLPSCSCNSKREVRMLVDLYRSRLLEYLDEIQMSGEDDGIRKI